MKTKHFLSLTRPKNLIFIVLTVLFGIYFRNQYLFHLRSAAAVISTVLIAAAGYAINDFFDIKADMINRPGRVLPSGKLSPKAAYIFSVVLFVLGINISTLTFKWVMFLLAIINSALLFYYAKSLKRDFLTGNILVAYTSASTFIYGALLSDNMRNCIWIILYAFLLTLIREIVKDMEDITGDQAIDANTLPLHLGFKKTSFIVLVLSFLPLLISIYSFFTGSVSLLYFILTLGSVFIPVIVLSFYLLVKNNKMRFSRASLILKLLMLLVLLITLFV